MRKSAAALLVAAPNGPAVLWLNIERHLHYTNYRTTLKAANSNVAPSVANP